MFGFSQVIERSIGSIGSIGSMNHASSWFLDCVRSPAGTGGGYVPFPALVASCSTRMETIILQMDKIWDPKKGTLEKNDQLVGRNAQLINYDSN